jgi:DNA-binding transcriptional LysR family regulator
MRLTDNIETMDIRKIDLNLLVILDMLLRLHSVSRTAEALDMSQPAVSFALTKLRALFDDPLFIRAPRGLRPTPRAEQLADPLREVLDQIRARLLEPPGFDPAASQRCFTFNMADVGQLVFLPRLRARLASAAPGANLRTVTLPPGQLEAALESGEVDLAVGYFPALQGATIYQQRLFSHSFVCLVRQDHPHIGDQISLAQFLGAQHVVVQRPGVSQEFVEQALAEQGLSRRVVLSVPHFLAIPLLVAESDLVVTVPYAVGKSFARMANLKVLRPPLPIRPVDIKQHWHTRYHHDQANLWLRGVVAELFVEALELPRSRTAVTSAKS